MGLLDELTGGGQQQESYQDYINRYQQGHPNDGISDEEAATRYAQVAGEVDPQTYQDSAREALAKMTPEERAAYAQQLGAAADGQGVDHGWDGSSTDPDALAQVTANVHQQSPGLLGGLLGGGGGGLGGLLGGGGAAGAGGGLGGMLGGILGGGGGGVGGVLGGGAQSGAGGGGLGGMLGGGGGNPIFKAVLGGIAAMAARKMMGGGGGGAGGGLGNLI